MIRPLVAILFIFGLCTCAPAPTRSATSVATQVVPPRVTASVEATQMVQVTETPGIPLAAEWAGAITLADGSEESITVKFMEPGGTLTIEPLVKTYPMTDLQQKGVEISFNITIKNELRFSGEIIGAQITGKVEGDGETSRFSLLSLQPAPRAALAQYAGTYQLGSGEALLINLAPEYSSSGLYFFGQGLMLTHFGTGAIRALYQVDKDTFLVGSARAIGHPFEAQITFKRDTGGNVAGLDWQGRDPKTGSVSGTQQAIRLGIKSDPVHFTSADGTDLAGIVTLPEGPGPYPAIMMLHGSEPGKKDDFGRQQMSAFMASRGVAVLTYDKRGVGESGGEYSERASETNLMLTAQDAIAGVEYLKSRADVIGDKIGLTGFSQAGWVIPLAASLSSDISYFIILSGPVTSVGHEDLYSSYTDDGDSARSYSLEEARKKLAGAPHSGFDSTPVIANLDRPGLWIFGEQDKSIPVFECVDNLRAIITPGKANFSYLVLPGADHNLQQTKAGLFNEIPYAPGFHPDYYKSMAGWLESNLK